MSYGFLHMNIPVLADQQRIYIDQLYVDIECRREDLPSMIAGR